MPYRLGVRQPRHRRGSPPRGDGQPRPRPRDRSVAGRHEGAGQPPERVSRSPLAIVIRRPARRGDDHAVGVISRKVAAEVGARRVPRQHVHDGRPGDHAFEAGLAVGDEVARVLRHW